MATSTALSLVDVVNALQVLTVEETKDLALQLRVELHILDSIEARYHGNSFKTHSFQSWLDNDVEAKWETIIAGLKRIGKNVLAERVATQYCPQSRVPVANSPSSDPSSSATAHTVQPVSPPTQAPVSGVTQSSITPAVTGSVPPIPFPISTPSNPPRPPDNDRVAEVKERVGHLESEFLIVVTQFRRAMTKNEVRDGEFLEDFRDALLLLPVAKRVSHARFFEKRESEIIAAKRVRILIVILCRYWNYSNYDLLQYLISVFGDEPLKGNMLKYCEILKAFEIETTIDIFLAAFSANSELSVAFSRIVAKINKPPSECTLHDIRKFREAFAVQSSICSYCIYVDTITASSVRMMLGFHPSALGWVLAALSPSFLENHQLSDIVVEGEPLLLYEIRDLNEQLLHASGAGDVVRVTSLLNSGADVGSVGYRSETPLDRASCFGHLHTVRLLLQRGAVVDSRDMDGWTPLIGAANQRKCDVVAELLENGGDINAQNGDGYSALIKAVSKGYTEVVGELVKAGANLNLQTNSGKSALMCAARDGQTEIIKQLVTADANLDLQNIGGYSALIWAARDGHTEVVQQLVKAGANLNLQNKNGDSAVIRATVKHKSGALQELVRAGADLNLQNEEGLTALMISARSGRTELADILLTGDDIDTDIQENSTGWSALSFAAERGDVTTTQSLLTAGANPLLKNKDGVTALEVAAASGRDDVHKLLTQHIDACHDVPPTEVSHRDESPLTDQDVLSSDSPNQDSQQANLDVPSYNQDTTAHTVTDHTQERRGISQTLRNMVSRSQQKAVEIFSQLDRRLKSVDDKSQSGVKDLVGEGAQKRQKKKRDEDRPPDNQTSSTTVTVHVQ